MRTIRVTKKGKKLLNSKKGRASLKRKLLRTKKTITYHGRKGKPVVHTSETGKKYIMVRKKSGGVKRLYVGSKYKTNKKTKILKL